MPIPTHTERPDLYDGHDFQEPRKPWAQTYLDRILPEHVKKLIAERQPTPSPLPTPE